MISDEQRDYMLANGFNIHEIRILIFLEDKPYSNRWSLITRVPNFYGNVFQDMCDYGTIMKTHDGRFILCDSIANIVKKRILDRYNAVF